MIKSNYPDQSRRVINALHRQNFRNARRQRLLRGYDRGGYPPSRPCPPGVDPETGEIKAEGLYSQVATELLGKRLPPSLIEYKSQRPVRYGRTALGVWWLVMPKNEVGRVARLVTAGILAVAITWGVIAYINTPHYEPGRAEVGRVYENHPDWWYDR